MGWLKGGGVSEETHTQTHTYMHTRSERETPPLPRFPVAYPASDLPPSCTLPAFIHAASGALSVVFPRRLCHWLITTAWPINAFRMV